MPRSIPVTRLWSRRDFLRATGVGALALGAAACGSSPIRTGGHAAASPVTGASPRFLSRPDLNPPTVTVTTTSPDLAPGLILVASGGPLLLDNAGQPVWYQPVKGMATTDLRAQVYRGHPILSWWQGQITKTGHGSGEHVLVDGAYREVARVRAGDGLSADLHELTITPQDTALVTSYSQTTTDLSSVGGSRRGTLLDSVLQEVDVATGDVLFEWRASDHVTLDESHSRPGGGVPYDFFHINSVNLDSDGDLLVSARNTWAVYKVGRHDGAVRWRLGGRRSDYRMGPGTVFAWQHDAHRQPNGTLTLFDDEASPKIGSQSRGLALRLDDSSRTASLVRQYRHPHPLLAGSQGSAEMLADRHVFVGWGALPWFSEFSYDGQLVYDAHFDGTGQSYRAYRSSWIGKPTDRPALALAPAGGSRAAHASWNGATEVASWQLLTGPDPGSLRATSVAPRSGFETVLPVDAGSAYMAVAALGASGAVQGTSSTVRI